MSNLVKKITSAIAGVAIVFSIVAPVSGVNAAMSSLDAANKLSQLGVIVDQSSNPADYRLGDNLSRREMVKIAMQLATCQGVSINTSYAGDFADLPQSDWGWKYAETALDNGFIAWNNNFSPDREVSKAEALKMVMNSTGVEKSSNSNWMMAYVEWAVSAGISTSFSDYTASAQRGWIFQIAAESIDLCSGDDEDDLLGDLLGGLDDEDEDTTDETDEETPVVSGDAVLTVSLSPETPDSATIPGAVSGLPAATFDFTAGSEDVTVTSLIVKRRGLSDKDTLTSLAAFTAEGRVSKGKNDSQENDTEAQLTLTDGVVIKAGETKAVTIVVDVAAEATSQDDEFALELVEVVASSTVEEEGSLVGNTLRVGSVDAAQIKITTGGSVSNPKIGEESVNIFKFKIEWANDEDTVLKTITFKANSWDAEDNLANIKLMNNGNIVATASSVNNKYLTFDLSDGVTIAENKTERFIVTADIVAWASETIGFHIDKKLDVTGIGNKYGYGLSVDIGDVDTNDLSTGVDLEHITIKAGELVLADIDASTDKIRSDKKDVVLGKIKVTNVAGKNLELLRFGVKTESTGTGFNNIFIDDSFELYNEESGTSYELTPKDKTLLTTYYQDEDLNITLPQGTVTFIIRADTKKNVPANTTVTLSLNSTLNWSVDANVADGQFYVEETDDDKTVTDLTPSSLTWKKLTVIISGASAARIPLANTKVVRGAENEVVMQFEIEADEASLVTVDEVKVVLTATGSAATNQEIAQVALYRGSVSDSNLLDRISGSNLAAGVATFEWFEVEIAADAKETFVVTANIVDWADAVTKSPIEAKLQWVSLEDDENDDVFLTGDANKDGTLDTVLDSWKDVTVTNVGELTVAEDTNNVDNEDPKTVLGWESATVFSADVQATNEDIDVETVTFTVDKDLTNAVTNASLYLGDTLIATNSNSDITTTTIKFEDLTTLIIPESSQELKLKINTETIGYQKVGWTVANTKVTAVQLSDAEGVESGKDVTVGVSSVATSNSETFSIVPAKLVVSVVDTLANGQAKLKVTVDTGDNTVDANNSAPAVLLTALAFSELGNNADGYKIYKDGESSRNGTISSTGVFSSGTGGTIMTSNDLTISDNETYVIVPTGTVDKTYTLNLTKTGITYTVNGVAASTGLTINTSEETSLGTKTY